MNSPIRNEGCEEELAAGGTPSPPLRVREAGKTPCHSACCRTPSRDISRPICLLAWSSSFAILPSRSGTTPGTEKNTVQSGRWISKFRRTTVFPSIWQKFITAFELKQLGLWGVCKVPYLRAKLPETTRRPEAYHKLVRHLWKVQLKTNLQSNLTTYLPEASQQKTTLLINTHMTLLNFISVYV